MTDTRLSGSGDDRVILADKLKLTAAERCDLILLTGREAAIAAKLRGDGQADDDNVVRRELFCLRPGSQSEEVSRLRQKLGLSAGPYFGPVTKTKLTERQTQQGEPADGIYTPDLDARWNWNVF